MTFENNFAGNKIGSTCREKTNTLSFHDCTSLPFVIVGQYTRKIDRLQHGILNKNIL